MASISYSATGIDYSDYQTQGTGSTQELLDHYEEGTWTATLSDGDSNAGMSTTVGVYTKVGRMVFCEIQMRNSNLTGISGAVRISGLPFTLFMIIFLL